MRPEEEGEAGGAEPNQREAAREGSGKEDLQRVLSLIASKSAISDGIRDSGE